VPDGQLSNGAGGPEAPTDRVLESEIEPLMRLF
jgi:hypothetical protein